MPFVNVISLLLLLICWVPVSANSEIDSLKSLSLIQLESGEQVDLMETYFHLGRAYLGIEETDSAYAEFLLCLGYAESLDDQYLQFRSLLELGQIDIYPRNNPQAAIRRLSLAESVAGDNITISDERRLYFELGNAYLNANDFGSSMAYQLKSVELAERTQDTAFLAASLRSLGSLYWQTDQFSQSLATYRRAYELRTSLPGPHFSIYSSMAIAHFSLNAMDSALHYIRKARLEAEQYEQVYGEAYSLGLIGNIKMEQGRYRQAIDSLELSVQLCEENNFIIDAISFQNDLGKAYGLNRQFEQALSVLRMSELVARELNQATLLTSNYEIQSDIYAWQGDSAKSLIYLKRYYDLKDSLVSEDMLAGMANLEKGYEIGKIEASVRDAEAALEQSEKMLYLYGFASGFIFLLVILYMAYVRNKALKEVNQVLEEKNAEIRRQNDRLASSNEDLRQFAHVTSHDLREPLRNISSFATLLSRKYSHQFDKDGSEYLSFITNGVRKMDRLLNDLLTYSVVGVFDHEYSDVDLGRTISDIMRRLQQHQATQGAKITLKKLPVVKANAQQMDQLFAQLIDNAIKFRDPSRKPEIVIRSEGRENGYVFSITDNGIGMDKAYKDKIFALFLRLHNQQSAYEGSGIGLSIVKKIIEQHEGKIWIESEVGTGTTVYFFLPKDPPTDSTPDHVRDRWQWLQEDVRKSEDAHSQDMLASLSDE